MDSKEIWCGGLNNWNRQCSFNKTKVELVDKLERKIEWNKYFLKLQNNKICISSILPEGAFEEDFSSLDYILMKNFYWWKKYESLICIRC